jgi:hypothetical protein
VVFVEELLGYCAEDLEEEFGVLVEAFFVEDG